jgi:hypothetical protein
MRLVLAVLATLCTAGTPALASSDDAWEQFRADVQAACLAMLEEPGTIEIEVNPFGSQSYGAAIVTVTSDGMGTDRMLCIYDKQTGAAEITTPF